MSEGETRVMDDVNKLPDDATLASQAPADDAVVAPSGDALSSAPTPAASMPDTEPSANLDSANLDDGGQYEGPPAYEEDENMDVAPLEEAAPDVPVATGERHWYILKVQSNREDSIREGLLRRIKIAGLESFFGDVIVPIEMVTEFKNGKKRVVKRKLFPGYIVVHMELNEDTWYLVRDTAGIGDFTGAGGKPSPMLPSEVERIVQKSEVKSDEAPKLKIAFRSGDRVKIREGTFENFEGDVDAIDEANGIVTVMINIFGRSTPVQFGYWQIEAI